jgi:magnesium-transporting ATPase (P-type)
VYFALGAAALTYWLTRDARSTISVIIVAGAIVKGGLFLEQLGRVNTVVLDKTGTLTYGQPEVRTLVPVAGTFTGQDDRRLRAGPGTHTERHNSRPAVLAFGAGCCLGAVSASPFGWLRARLHRKDDYPSPRNGKSAGERNDDGKALQPGSTYGLAMIQSQ